MVAAQVIALLKHLKNHTKRDSLAFIHALVCQGSMRMSKLDAAEPHFLAPIPSWNVSGFHVVSCCLGLVQMSKLDAAEAARLQNWPAAQVWWLQAASPIINLSLEYPALVSFFASQPDTSYGLASSICEVPTLPPSASLQ